MVATMQANFVGKRKIALLNDNNIVTDSGLQLFITNLWCYYS